MSASERPLDELRSFMKCLPVAALLADMNGVVLDSNDEAPAIFRHTAAGSSALRRADWFCRMAQKAGAGAEVQTVKLARRSRPDGGRCKMTGITFYEDGRPSGLLLVGIRPDELRADKRYRQLLDDLLEPVAVHRRGTIVYANPQIAALLGVESPEWLIGRSIADFVHPDYRDLVFHRMKMVEQGTVAETIEEKIITAHGAVLDVEVRASRIPFGGDYATQVIVRDVTRRRQIEAGLQASQQRYRAFTESVRDYAVVALDCDGRIISWNAAAVRVTGFAAEDVIGNSFAILLSTHDGSPEDVVRDMLDSSLQGQRESEHWARHRERDEYRASITVTAMRAPDGSVVGFTAVLHDLSKQHEIEMKLQRSEEQLRQAQKMDAIGRLSAGIAHDFKNLLTAINGHAQFLLEDLPASSELRTDVVEIKRAADRAAELTRQLLTFARKQEIQPQILDVNEVVQNLEKMLRRLIRADLAFHTHLSPGLPLVKADRGQLEQVMMNLVVNARDATPSGGSISILTSSFNLDERYAAGGLDLNPGRYVMIGVTDTGIGMDADTQRQIFEPFFTTKRDEGTGLGLAIVYGIVRRTGGHVSVYSEPGHGTTVKIFLPATGAEVTSAVRSEKPVAATNGHASETVLVVEDDDAIRSLAIRILKARGYPVLAAENGAAAIDVAQAHQGPIDLLLTDLMMPGLNGDALATRIRQMYPDVAVMFMSGFSEPAQNDAARAHDATFLEKPFAPDELARRVAEALQGRR